MKIKDLLTDIRTYIGIVVFFTGITYWVITWAEVPTKVKKVEKKAEEVEDKVQQVATTVDKFVLEQRLIQQNQEKREALMLKLIERNAVR